MTARRAFNAIILFKLPRQLKACYRGCSGLPPPRICLILCESKTHILRVFLARFSKHKTQMTEKHSSSVVARRLRLSRSTFEKRRNSNETHSSFFSLSRASNYRLQQRSSPEESRVPIGCG